MSTAWPRADGAAERVRFVTTSTGGEYANPVWGEWLELHDGTDVVARYASGDLAGRAAVTRRPHGDGVAWYVSAVLDPDGLLACFREALGVAGLPARDRVDTDLEAVTRSDATTDYTFVLNHGRRELAVEVPSGAEDLLGTGVASGRLVLQPFGAAVLATARAEHAPFITLSDTTD